MKKIIFAAVAGLVLSEVQALNSDMYAPETMEAVRLNCTCLSLKALLELDEIEKMEVATK
jgi:hypothetical protein